MAHKKGQGSSGNGRDSNANSLGVKRSDGMTVISGNIIVRQRGNSIRAGRNVGTGRDYTLYARADGQVQFETRGKRKYVSIV